VIFGLDVTKKEFHSENYFHIDCNLLDFSKDINYRTSLLNNIKQKFPKDIDEFIILNNAANQVIKDFNSAEWEDWDVSLNINTIAPFFLIQSFSEHLCHCKGKVINISSIHAKQTKRGFSIYAASKSALESLTRSLAIELSPYGVSVNAVSPAAIRTEMLLDGFKDDQSRLKELEEFHPSRSIGSPKDLAIFIKALTDFNGRFLTGSNIEFNGGISGVLNDPESN